MGKIKVEICLGTACYLLGADRMMTLTESVPVEFRDRVDIEVKSCLGLCERGNLGGAPYVRFDGNEIMTKATPEKVVERILELASEGKAS